jgi:hypothetical protein
MACYENTTRGEVKKIIQDFPTRLDLVRQLLRAIQGFSGF